MVFVLRSRSHRERLGKPPERGRPAERSGKWQTFFNNPAAPVIILIWEAAVAVKVCRSTTWMASSLSGIMRLERRQLGARLAPLVVPEVDVAVEAGALLDQIQELWREATVDERHDLLAGMIDSVYVHMSSQRVVGITAKGPFRDALDLLTGPSLCLQKRPIKYCNGGDGGESNPSSRGKPTRMCYRLSRRFDLARRTSAANLPPGQPKSLRSLAIGVGETAPRHCVVGPGPSG
jgi:hypothetical protein